MRTPSPHPSYAPAGVGGAQHGLCPHLTPRSIERRTVVPTHEPQKPARPRGQQCTPLTRHSFAYSIAPARTQNRRKQSCVSHAPRQSACESLRGHELVRCSAHVSKSSSFVNSCVAAKLLAFGSVFCMRPDDTPNPVDGEFDPSTGLGEEARQRRQASRRGRHNPKVGGSRPADVQSAMPCHRASHEVVGITRPRPTFTSLFGKREGGYCPWILPPRTFPPRKK